MPYPILFRSHLIGDITLNANQYLVIHTKDTQLINDFLLWVEGSKRFANDSVHFIKDGKVCTDFYELKKHLKVLRFQLKDKLIGDYYQQRYHATENDDLISLGEFIGNVEDEFLKLMVFEFGLDKLMDEKLNMLSTGEFKKAMAIKMASENNKLLIIEEPGIGVDTESREHINKLFEHLAQKGTSVVVFTSTTKWPYQTEQLINLNEDTESEKVPSTDLIEIPQLKAQPTYEYLFELNNIVVRYHNRNVLSNVSWKVRPKEKWALSGKNGAGKSTLLSIIYADNPQSYSNDVYSFGFKRGSGQSIWDIKQQIGFYSSELHRYINKRQKVEDVIRNLVIQNPYKKRDMNDEELTFRRQLLHYFDLDDSLKLMFYELSTVRQKLIILCGVLVKNAPLLILDEPLQGFSDELVIKALQLLLKYTSSRTLIMVSHDKSYPSNIQRFFHLENGEGSEVQI